MVIDCRFLPNPYWDESLRPLSGLDVEVRTFVMQQEATIEFLSHLDALLTLLLPAYVREGKSYLSLAFGCTGGQHRSVVVAEEVARGCGSTDTSPWSCIATSTSNVDIEPTRVFWPCCTGRW